MSDHGGRMAPLAGASIAQCFPCSPKEMLIYFQMIITARWAYVKFYETCVHNFDSSALLVMKAHQQNTWKTFIFRSLDFCHAIAVPQVPKASLLQSVEFYWLVKGQKRAQGIGSEGLL